MLWITQLCCPEESVAKLAYSYRERERDCLFVCCLTSQQQASVSQGQICPDNFTCCHTEIEVADQTFYLTQSQYTDSGPTSPSADPITPGAWQGSHWSANFKVTGMTHPRKKPWRKRDLNLGSSVLEVDALPLGQRGGERERERDLLLFVGCLIEGDQESLPAVSSQFIPVILELVIW